MFGVFVLEIGRFVSYPLWFSSCFTIFYPQCRRENRLSDTHSMSPTPQPTKKPTRPPRLPGLLSHFNAVARADLDD